MTDPALARLDQIRDRHQKATPGPWFWGGNVDVRHIYLAASTCGTPIVMSFTRWGMQGAQPQFAVGRRSDEPIFSGRLTKASDLPVFQVNRAATRRDDPSVYRGDIVGIRHPDADFIAAARTDVPAMEQALRAVLGIHQPVEEETGVYCAECANWGYWPCRTYLDIRTALGEAQ